MALDFSTYPPKGHQERIAAYQRYERLFLGQHKLVFAVTPQPITPFVAGVTVCCRSRRDGPL